MCFDTRSALEYAARGRLEEWVHAYLNGGSWRNLGLSEGLKLQQRWWSGPVELPLSMLDRCVGTEEGKEYRVNQVYWESRMTDMIAGIRSTAASPLDMPPLIASYDLNLPSPARLSVRDGNHRLGAYERLGWPSAWVLIWYNSFEEYTQGNPGMIQASAELHLEGD